MKIFEIVDKSSKKENYIVYDKKAVIFSEYKEVADFNSEKALFIDNAIKGKTFIYNVDLEKNTYINQEQKIYTSI